MGFRQSVRFKIVFGFFLVLLPMIVFLVYNNVYATNVARNQISSNIDRILAMSVSENDKILNEYRNYLYRLERFPDIPIIQSLPVDDDEYILAKIRLLNQFALDSGGIYNNMDSLYIFSRRAGEMIYATQYNDNSADKQEALLKLDGTYAIQPLSRHQLWDSIEIGDGAERHYLLKTYDLGSDVYAGVLVRTSSLMAALESFDIGPDGSAMLIDQTGGTVGGGRPALMDDDAFRTQVKELRGSYGTIKHAGQKYLVFSRLSEYADLNYVLVTTEPYLLKSLPFFQKVLYFWIPLMAALLLTLYLLFLQRVMFGPLVELIRGMRKLGQGRFDIRLPTNRSTEFAFMSGTFNQMAEQIEKLKIDVYEEQLRVQKAEYKHLQIQINPHFYMNCLNIIYNLAALKDYKSVQKLSLHLADYFRFLMQSHRSVVRLEDEIRHIGHYLEIQKLRYLDKLEYEIALLPQHGQLELSPLMIQPFVENAVIHGYNRRKLDGTAFRIRLETAEDPDEPERFMRLRVTDNGPGFGEEMLRELATDSYGTANGGGAALGPGSAAGSEAGHPGREGGTGGRGDTGSGQGEHLGIWNIMRRFKMMYGDEGGISFGNAVSGGAVVELRLPLERPDRMDAEETERPAVAQD